ncbi:hypothetical protein NYO91_17485 [Arhodomonas aquaeolei]|uniref:hypothetical protein n=1 Tax=Arhodomonas aquaeolei TaxID=2369 RepID=UPI002169E85C|nr:hypothetical protein [Arhodomonas aquaeolei]MCS4505877.1 hypothetical protein [Arhodomonas aquaeolei]
MLDRLFMKYLSRTGVWCYWVGQIALDIILLGYLFGIAGYSFDDESVRTTLIVGVLGVAVVWGGVCLVFWRRQDEPEGETASTGDS